MTWEKPNKKTGQRNLKTSLADEELIAKAKKNLEEISGKKVTVSKAIYSGLEQLANQTPPSAKPELFFINRKALKDIDINIAEGLTILQTIIDQFAKIGISADLEEVETWFGSGSNKRGVTNREKIREAVITKLFEIQKKKYDGLQFERANVEVPDLTALFEECGKVIYIHEIQLDEVGLFWHCYQIADGKVIIIPEIVETVKNKYRAYAKSPHEKMKLQKARELCDLLGKLRENEVFPPEKLNLAGVAYWDAESNRYEPHPQYIIFGMQETLFFTYK